VRDKVRISRGTPLSKAQRYLERGLAAHSRAEYDDALADLDEAINQERRNAELYATRGYILQEAGYTDEAEADFEKALKIDPSQWVVHYARAMEAFRNEDYDNALAYLAQAQRIVPLRPELFIYRAAAYYAKGEKSAAEREIDSAVQVLPSGDKRLKIAQKWKAEIKKL
jgi:Flp pilus assembly protein TadD